MRRKPKQARIFDLQAYYLPFLVVLLVAFVLGAACSGTGHSDGEDGLDATDALDGNDGRENIDEVDGGDSLGETAAMDSGDVETGDDDGTDGADDGCTEPLDFEKYCINPNADECRYIGSYCLDGQWICDTGFEHPPPPPDFDDWAWLCGVYACYAWDVPAEPGPDWQEEQPYVPPDPGSLKGEWLKIADSDDIVPVGCERQPRGYADVTSLVVNPQNPDVMYTSFGVLSSTPHNFAAGVFKSVDGGQTWFEARAGLGASGCYGEECKYGPSVNTLYMDPDDPNVLFASTTERGLYRSTDGGRYWKFIDLPYECAWAGPVGKAPSGAYFLGCEGTIYHSLDGGATFEQGITLGKLGRHITAFSFDQRYPERVWAGMCEGCEGSPVDGEGFMFLSDDGGNSWKELGQDIDSFCQGSCAVWDIAICPHDPSQMAAAVYPCGLFLSRDEGNTWYRGAPPMDMDADTVASVEYAPMSDRCRLYSAEQGLYKLYYSDDAGFSWTIEFEKCIDDLFFNPYMPEIIYGIIKQNMYNDKSFELYVKK